MLLSDVCLTPDVCLTTSVAYIGPKSRTKRPRKTKIGIEVAHVTRDSDTTFKVKRSKVKVTGAGAYCGGLPQSLLWLSSSYAQVSRIEQHFQRARLWFVVIRYLSHTKKRRIANLSQSPVIATTNSSLAGLVWSWRGGPVFSSTRCSTSITGATWSGLLRLHRSTRFADCCELIMTIDNDAPLVQRPENKTDVKCSAECMCVFVCVCVCSSMGGLERSVRLGLVALAMSDMLFCTLYLMSTWISHSAKYSPYDSLVRFYFKLYQEVGGLVMPRGRSAGPS